MEIYVVRPDDNIDSIANKYGVSTNSIIQSNELINPYDLVPGQTIVIAFPKQTHTVMDGDTIESIAKYYEVSVMQLLRNNPYLSQRNFIYPGEVLIISYETRGDIAINGFTYPYIPLNTLIKTLPYLTYISIFNYRQMPKGEIISYYDDTEIIRISKEFGTAPLLMISSLNELGEPSYASAYELLLNDTYQENAINNILKIAKEKGYYGINLSLSYINQDNVALYNHFVVEISNRVKQEGLHFSVTVNPKVSYTDGGLIYENVDYTTIGQVADEISFTHYIWGKNMEQPGPVSSVTGIQHLLDYVLQTVPSQKIRIGMPVVGYDWALPYVPGKTVANAITVNSALNLANESGRMIQFDEVSQTPFFNYYELSLRFEIEHVVWFIDSRSVNSMLGLVSEYNLSGKGVWNIMVYYAQMWLVINSQYMIIKILPDQL